MNKALLLLAAAVVAHPFISKAIDGANQYKSSREAQLACKAVAAEIPDKASIRPRYDGPFERAAARCYEHDNHWALQVAPIDKGYPSVANLSYAQKQNETRRFYF